MLRLYDVGRREVVPVEPARRGQLRLDIQGPAATRPVHVADLRPVLVADLIRRTAERRRLTVLASDDGERPAFRADCDALGVRPPEFATWRELGELIDIRVTPAGSAPDGRRPVARLQAASGPVLFEGQEAAGVTLAGLGQRGLDPLALRLAYLDRGYREALDLGWPALAEAYAELRRWRAQVAEWANQPSRPLSGEHAGQVIAAFEDDLNTPAALDALRALASDAAVPAGAKFETFAHLDQLLGLDLASEIGRVPAPPPAPR